MSIPLTSDKNKPRDLIKKKIQTFAINKTWGWSLKILEFFFFFDNKVQRF